MSSLRVLPESRWTRPTDACPHPEWWHSLDPESTEIEVSEMLAGLVRGVQPELCVETGACLGQTSFTIGEALRKNGHGRLVSIERDPRRAEAARRHVDGLPVEIVCDTSTNWSPGAPIDFAFFDSERALRVKEFQSFRRYMHACTVLAFHDVAGRHQALRAELESLEGDGVIRLLLLPTPRGIALAMPL